MHALESLQAEFAQAILAGNSAHIAQHLTAGKADPAARFGIYRNNTFLSLTAALATTFPVTVSLVDERFFRYAADSFIRRIPPREPRLCEYGAALPAFLRAFPACRQTPFVADVAEFEWAVSRALLAPEQTALGPQVLQRVSGDAGMLALRLQPSLRFVATRWPAFGIWLAHQPDARAMPVDMRRGIWRCAVSRRSESVRITALSSGEFAFVRSLAHGGTVEAAFLRARRRDPMFDLVAALVALFRDGLVIAVHKP